MSSSSAVKRNSSGEPIMGENWFNKPLSPFKLSFQAIFSSLVQAELVEAHVPGFADGSRFVLLTHLARLGKVLIWPGHRDHVRDLVHRISLLTHSPDFKHKSPYARALILQTQIIHFFPHARFYKVPLEKVTPPLLDVSFIGNLAAISKGDVLIASLSFLSLQDLITFTSLSHALVRFRWIVFSQQFNDFKAVSQRQLKVLSTLIRRILPRENRLSLAETSSFLPRSACRHLEVIPIEEVRLTHLKPYGPLYEDVTRLRLVATEIQPSSITSFRRAFPFVRHLQAHITLTRALDQQDVKAFWSMAALQLRSLELEDSAHALIEFDEDGFTSSTYPHLEKLIFSSKTVISGGRLASLLKRTPALHTLQVSADPLVFKGGHIHHPKLAHLRLVVWQFRPDMPSSDFLPPNMQLFFPSLVTLSFVAKEHEVFLRGPKWHLLQGYLDKAQDRFAI